MKTTSVRTDAGDLGVAALLGRQEREAGIAPCRDEPDR